MSLATRYQSAADFREDLVKVAESVGGLPKREQIARLQAVKAGRDADKVAALLGRLDAAARQPDAPLTPLIVECVENYVTLGEICGLLRDVFGEYQPDVWV